MDIEATVIQKTNRLPSEDYDFLKEEGLRHIETLSSRIWTDYNSHDPGITLLELLAYAITDLGQRTGLETVDLLTADPGTSPTYDKNYHKAELILPNNSHSDTDFRKLMMDLDGVINAWIRPRSAPNTGDPTTPDADWWVDYTAGALVWGDPLHSNARKFDELNGLTVNGFTPMGRFLNGLYDVVVEFERNLLVTDPTDPDAATKIADQDSLVDDSRVIMQDRRNLCEDLFDLRPSDGTELINLVGDIEIGAQEDAERIMANVLFQIERFLSPAVNFYSLSELLDKGLRTDEIFQGAIPTNGFILDEEVERIVRRDVIHVSDLIQIIMDVPGVEGINDLLIGSDLLDRTGTLLEAGTSLVAWTLPLLSVNSSTNAGDYQLVLRNAPNMTSLTFSRGYAVAPVDLQKVQQILEGLRLSDRKSRNEAKVLGIDIPEGDYLDLEAYYPAQNELPMTYGTGPEGLGDLEPDDRKAKAKQLKTYLLFYEQVLANYFAQLKQVNHLLSWDTVDKTYFSQVVQDIANDSDLYLAGSMTLGELDLLAEEPQGEGWYDRRSRFLNHLLARFNEEMTDYTLLMFAMKDKQRTIEDKMDVLDNYVDIGGNRGRAFDYTQIGNVWATFNNTGFERRVGTLLGFDDVTRRDLAGFAANDPLAEGFHAVEHILLRPRNSSHVFMPIHTGPDEAGSCLQDLDPYSFRVTVVAPAWPERFTDYRFRFHMENVMRLELPAHIALDVIWVSEADMASFESCWHTFLDELAADPEGISTDPMASLGCVVNLLDTMEDVYEAEYEVLTEKNEDAYLPGDIIARVTDPVGPVESATWFGPGQTTIVGTDGWPGNATPQAGFHLPAPYNKFFHLITDQDDLDDLLVAWAGAPAGLQIGDIVALPGVETVISTADGTFNPLGLDMLSTSGGAPLTPVWELRIKTINDVGGVNYHLFNVKVINDKEAVYPSSIPAVNEDTLSPGDVIATPTDPDDVIVSATVVDSLSGYDDIATYPWLNFNTSTGEFSVASTPVVARTYLFKVITVDNDGGQTVGNLTFRIIPDQEAYYTLPVSCQGNAFSINEDALTTHGQVVAICTDPDGAVTSAQLATGSSLPPFLVLDAVSGNITLDTVQTVQPVTPGTYVATIETVDVVGGMSSINFTLTILADQEAIYTLQSGKSINCYCPGSIVATVTDPDGPIISVTLTSGSIPPGMTLQPDGSITIDPPTISGGGGGAEEMNTSYQRMAQGAETETMQFRAEAQMESAGQSPYIPVPCDNDLIPGTYSFTIVTEDACHGITEHDLSFTIYPDRDPVWALNRPRAYHTYITTGEVLATPSDPDGPIIFAELASQHYISPGLGVDRYSGAIVITNLHEFYTFFAGGDVIYMDVRTVDACGGESITQVRIEIFPDTPAVYEFPGMRTASNVRTAGALPQSYVHRHTLYAGNYSPGDLIAFATDADQSPINRFRSVRIVSGTFIRGADLSSVTGEITVDTGIAGNNNDAQF